MNPTLPRRAPIPVMVDQHLEVAMHLHGTRQVLLDAPHARLHQLGRLDERLLAHLDGLAIADEAGRRASDATLAGPFSGGETFVATVLALQARDAARLDRLLALAEAAPEAAAGIAAAFGWVSAPHLRGVTRALLDSPAATRRAIGLQACAAHQVDPGAVLDAACDDPEDALAATAWRVAGELGRTDLLPAALRTLQHPQPAARFEAARAALRLGDRQAALAALQALASATGPHQADALAAWLLAAPPEAAHAQLKALPADPAGERLRVRGAGWSGDPFYVPWLLKQTRSPTLARVAGEAFSAITGTDLAALDLDGNAPAGVTDGPQDHPADDRVSLDDDESLPWPDPVRLADWWQASGDRFVPGHRYFVGEAVTAPHATHVLIHGLQRQRVRAAELLVLLKPGSPCFNTGAPSHRQQRLLAAHAGV